MFFDRLNLTFCSSFIYPNHFPYFLSSFVLNIWTTSFYSFSVLSLMFLCFLSSSLRNWRTCLLFHPLFHIMGTKVVLTLSYNSSSGLCETWFWWCPWLYSFGMMYAFLPIQFIILNCFWFCFIFHLCSCTFALCHVFFCLLMYGLCMFNFPEVERTITFWKFHKLHL